MTNEYPYATGSLIDQPNTYFYSKYGATDFMRAWAAQRNAARDALGAGAADAPDGAVMGQGLDNWPIDTRDLLEHVFSSLSTGETVSRETQLWLNRLIKKFEVTKRIHQAYRDGFIAVDKRACRDLSLYVRLGEVFDRAYETTGALSALNAFLKVVDTLCSQVEHLDHEFKPRLARLIENEAKHVSELAREKAVTW